MSVDIQFLGAAGTVTGSKYLLRTQGKSLLVDCGLFQGLKALRLRNWEAPPIRPQDLDAVVLTHAHLDHSGYLPVIAPCGFDGPVIASRGTRDLCAILLPDAGHLQEEEAAYANRRGFSKHKPALPLYTEEQAREALKLFRCVDYGEEMSLGKAFSAELKPAGHILGASIATIQVEGLRIVFSGDLGRYEDPIMRPPAPIEAADCLVVESTYGNRLHEAADPEGELGAHLKRVLDRRGVAVIPAFAVGRAQAMLFYISRLKARGAIPDVPVFPNSPMAIDATQLYHQYRNEHRLTLDESQAACTVAKMVHTAEDSKALNLHRGRRIEETLGWNVHVPEHGEAARLT